MRRSLSELFQIDCHSVTILDFSKGFIYVGVSGRWMSIRDFAVASSSSTSAVSLP